LFAYEASKEVVSDLPTPPLPLTTAITFFTDAFLCGAFNKLSFFLDAQLPEAQVEQLCVQFSDIVLSSLCYLDYYTPTAKFCQLFRLCFTL
jgi:hypothetical protein